MEEHPRLPATTLVNALIFCCPFTVLWHLLNDLHPLEPFSPSFRAAAWAGWGLLSRGEQISVYEQARASAYSWPSAWQPRNQEVV